VVVTLGILLVDPQLDFFPGGSLAVTDGDHIIKPVIHLLDTHRHAPLFASRDWHPPSTRHFADRGGRWPPHCVQGTTGATFHADLNLTARGAIVVDKGTNPEDDGGYSSFDGARDGVPLFELLQRAQVDTVIVAGLATDHCVKATVLSARAHGLSVFVLEDGVRAVNVDAGDEQRAWAAMRDAGAWSMR
jgi:nicotinamidase/pyrazinamidase